MAAKKTPEWMPEMPTWMKESSERAERMMETFTTLSGRTIAAGWDELERQVDRSVEAHDAAQKMAAQGWEHMAQATKTALTNQRELYTAWTSSFGAQA